MLGKPPTTDMCHRDINEPLYNHIYYENELNINKVAQSVGYTRQYLWAVLHRRMKASFKFARKICDALEVKEIRTLFRPDDLEEPQFITADKYVAKSSSGNNGVVNNDK